jgi:hypothetical protein
LVVPAQAAPAQALATHGVVHVGALDVTTTEAGGGGDKWVCASNVKEEVATVDEIAFREAEIWVDRDSVQVSLRMPALETEQLCAMRWTITSVEELCSRAPIECVREVGTRPGPTRWQCLLTPG